MILHYCEPSPYSDSFGELFLVDFSGDEPELVDRFNTEQDIGEIIYVEKYDLFVASSFESETLTSYRINDRGVVELGRLSNQGLIAGFSVISSTSSADIILVSTHARDGSRIGLTDVNAEGQFRRLNGGLSAKVSATSPAHYHVVFAMTFVKQETYV